LRNCFKHQLLLALFAGIFPIAHAQDFLPVLSDNYMGINQVFLQPASIADSRFKSDFNVGGFNNDIYNDAMHFRSRWIMDPTGIVFNDDWWDENTYLAPNNGKDKNLFMSQALLGPGFMATIDKKNKFAIGFTSRVRSITNADGIAEPLFGLIYSNYSDTRYFNRWYHDKDMRAVQHIFGDYGLTFAGVVLNRGEHFVKAGGTLKLLQGIAASYLQTNDLYYYYDGSQYPGSKPMSLNSPYVYSGLSDNWGFYDEQGVYNFAVNYQLTAKPSVGLDLGVVYEFRPEFFKYKYLPKDGKDSTDRFDLNKYFIKVGISVLDLGRLKYTKDYNSSDLVAAFTPDYLNRYDAGDNGVPSNTYWMDGNDIRFTFWNYVNFADTIYHRSINGQGIQMAASNEEKFTVRLPAAFSLQFDINLFLKGLYVNFTSYTALNKGFSRKPNSHYISNYSITPRYENKWYSVSVPVQINQYKKLDVGLGIRAGVVYAGVNNLFSNVFSDPYGMHWYVGLKVPLPYKNPTKPPKPPKPAPQPQIIICCPCTDNAQADSLCKKCLELCARDTSNLKKMNCIPCCGQIIINNPTINISTSPSQPPQLPQPSPPSSPSPSPSTPSQPPAVPCIQFEFDKSDLITSEIPYLVDLSKILNENPSYELIIYGHTDSYGSDNYNMNLSRKRAEAARAYLLNKGVRNHITIQPCGESQPIADNNTETGRRLNRRVCFELIKNESGNLINPLHNRAQTIPTFILTPEPAPVNISNQEIHTEPLQLANSTPTDGIIPPGKRKRHSFARRQDR
jgi:outer membrane protein OmpA-like peptidoglycan-associated protein